MTTHVFCIVKGCLEDMAGPTGVYSNYEEAEASVLRYYPNYTFIEETGEWMNKYNTGDWIIIEKLPMDGKPVSDWSQQETPHKRIKRHNELQAKRQRKKTEEE